MFKILFDEKFQRKHYTGSDRKYDILVGYSVYDAN